MDVVEEAPKPSCSNIETKPAPECGDDCSNITTESAPECGDDGEMKIPSILDSISQQEIDNFKPYYERYFEKKYCTKFSNESLNLDTCIRVHTNKVCVIYLSEKHSIVQNGQRIKSLNFQVSTKVNRLKNSMSGKGKRGAQLLQPDSVLCFIETEDGVKYPVHTGVHGKLLEINSRILENPNLLVDDLCEGFLAIILPDLKRREENIKSLKNVDEYNT